MSCILYPFGCFQKLQQESQLANFLFDEVKLSDCRWSQLDRLDDFLFQLNVDAFITRYGEKDRPEVDRKRNSPTSDYDFDKVTDWNSYQQIHELLGSVVYQCSEFEDDNDPHQSDIELIRQMRSLCYELAIDQLMRGIAEGQVDPSFGQFSPPPSFDYEDEPDIDSMTEWEHVCHHDLEIYEDRDPSDDW